MSDDCLVNQILLLDGTCEECPEYFYASEDGYECNQENCDDDSQYLLINGTCGECESFTHSTDDNTACISELCEFS